QRPHRKHQQQSAHHAAAPPCIQITSPAYIMSRGSHRSGELMNTTSDELQYGRGYPRPQLRRDGWRSLDGPWQFAIDESAAWSHPDEVAWDRTIRVPFSPETRGSGIAQSGFFRACWYRRHFA